MSYQPARCKSVARAGRRRRQHKEVGQRQADLSALTLRLIETDPPFCGQRSLLLLSTLAGESGDLNDTPLSYPCFFAPSAIDHAAKLPASKHNCKLADRNRARRERGTKPIVRTRPVRMVRPCCELAEARGLILERRRVC